MERGITWYQDQFGRTKVDYQSRRGRSDNEVLAFVGPDGYYRVTYIRVDQQGVTVSVEELGGIYANWDGGDRYAHMFHALKWIKLIEETTPPQMKWDEYSSWEVIPPCLK